MLHHLPPNLNLIPNADKPQPNRKLAHAKSQRPLRKNYFKNFALFASLREIFLLIVQEFHCLGPNQELDSGKNGNYVKLG
jgi:hypothetical protein